MNSPDGSNDQTSEEVALSDGDLKGAASGALGGVISGILGGEIEHDPSAAGEGAQGGATASGAEF